jgi:hypothetical protein
VLHEKCVHCRSSKAAFADWVAAAFRQEYRRVCGRRFAVAPTSGTVTCYS